MYAVVIAGVTQQRKVYRVVHAHITCALYQRFDDHRTDLRGVTLEGLLHRFEAAYAVVVPRFARLPVVAVG